jgi:hypothetical protein
VLPVPVPHHSGHLRLPVALGIFAGIVATTALSSSATSAATVRSSPAAASLLHSALASATREGSVRVTVHFVSNGVTGEVVQDSSQHAAKETVAIGQERVSIVLAGGTAYFVGNSQGLLHYFGFPQKVAGSKAGQWISVKSSDPSFQTVTAGLTLAAALKEAAPTGTLAQGKESTVNHQVTHSIVGTGSSGGAPSTIFVSTRGAHLPVESAASSGHGASESGEIVTFSRWGETFSVPKPSTSIPISTLSATSAASD